MCKRKATLRIFNMYSDITQLVAVETRVIGAAAGNRALPRRVLRAMPQQRIG